MSNRPVMVNHILATWLKMVEDQTANLTESRTPVDDAENQTIGQTEKSVNLTANPKASVTAPGQTESAAGRHNVKDTIMYTSDTPQSIYLARLKSMSADELIQELVRGMEAEDRRLESVNRTATTRPRISTKNSASSEHSALAEPLAVVYGKNSSIPSNLSKPVTNWVDHNSDGDEANFPPGLTPCSAVEEKEWLARLDILWGQVRGSNTGHTVTLPRGYRVFRNDPKSRQQYRYVYGHPGRRCFKTVEDFLVHYCHIVDDTLKTCACVCCKQLRLYGIARKVKIWQQGHF